GSRLVAYPMDGGRSGDPTTVPTDRAASGRTRAPAGGGGGSGGGGRGRRVRGGARHGSVPARHSRGSQGAEGAWCGGPGPGGDPAPRGGGQGYGRSGSDVADGLGEVDRADDARGSGVALAVDLQKRAAAGRRVDPPRTSHEPSYGRRTTPAVGVQPAGQPQDDRGHPAPGSQRPVRAHQRPG